MAIDLLPSPPAGPLAFGKMALRFVRIVPGDETRGLVPYYHFRIIATEGADVGRINFRIGDSEHVLLCVGHLGFEIAEPFRGRHFALQACHAIAPFVRSIYKTVIITSNPNNLASIRTIERLGANFIDEVAVPPHDPHYQSGSRSKKRYRWKP